MATTADLIGPHFIKSPACADYEPELWWGEHDSAGMLLALQICQACPAQDECLEYALEHPEREGIWGGTMPATRQRMLNARRKAVA